MEQGMSRARVANFIRTVAALLALSALMLSLGAQSLNRFREWRMENWPPGELCRSAAAAEFDGSGERQRTAYIRTAVLMH
jgi:hypothetical protein